MKSPAGSRSIRVSAFWWKPLHVILATSSQPSTTLKSAGFEASTGIVTSIWRKLPGNPEWTDDPAMVVPAPNGAITMFGRHTP